MTSFNPTEHPRAGDGQFTTKARSEPSFVLDLDAQTEAEYEAAEAHLETATRKVADLLPSNAVSWEGDGPSIFFGSRDADDCFGDYAFIRIPADGFEKDPHLDLHWQFQTEDLPQEAQTAGAPYPPASVVSEELTIDSDPREVAAWIQAQMDRCGTPPLRPQADA